MLRAAAPSQAAVGVPGRGKGGRAEEARAARLGRLRASASLLLLTSGRRPTTEDLPTAPKQGRRTAIVVRGVRASARLQKKWGIVLCSTSLHSLFFFPAHNPVFRSRRSVPHSQPLSTSKKVLVFVCKQKEQNDFSLSTSAPCTAQGYTLSLARARELTSLSSHPAAPHPAYHNNNHTTHAHTQNHNHGFFHVRFVQSRLI